MTHAGNSYEVIVVGGGINGAAVLYHLVAGGVRDCVLIERGRIAGGPTGVSSAVVRQHYADETYAKMALESLRFFQRFGELTGGDAGFRPIGYLLVAPDHHASALRTTVEMHQRLGIRTSWVSPSEIAQLEPLMLTEEIAGGAFEPESGYADPAGTTAALVAWSAARGAAVWRDTAVTRIVTRGGRVVGVETPGGLVSADRVVVAAGPWTADLARGVGVELPLRPSREPVASIQCADGQRTRHVVADVANQIYLRPEGAELLIVGGLASASVGSDADPDTFDRSTTSAEDAFFVERVLARFPALRSARSRGGWAGIYDMSPDRRHIIDELPGARGCFVVCGTSGHGFKLGPAVGALVVDLVLGRAPRHQASAFGLARFAA